MSELLFRGMFGSGPSTEARTEGVVRSMRASVLKTERAIRRIERNIAKKKQKMQSHIRMGQKRAGKLCAKTIANMQHAKMRLQQNASHMESMEATLNIAQSDADMKRMAEQSAHLLTDLGVDFDAASLASVVRGFSLAVDRIEQGAEVIGETVDGALDPDAESDEDDEIMDPARIFEEALEKHNDAERLRMERVAVPRAAPAQAAASGGPADLEQRLERLRRG